MVEEATMDKEGRILLKDGGVFIRGDRKDISPDQWHRWSDDYIRKTFGISKRELEEKEKFLTGKSGAPDHEQNAETQIIPATKVEDFTEMERVDEDQMIEEMRGRVLDNFVYVIESKTKTGETKPNFYLTYAGIKTIIQRMGNITIEDVVVTETEDTYRAKAIVRNTKNNMQVLGIVEQSKTMKLKDGTTVRDEFALQKATSKAIRNAYRLLIPEAVASAIIQEWLKNKSQ